MKMKTKKGDFVEFDFTARIKGGPVFDTTIKEEAEKSGLINKNDKHEQEGKKQEEKEEKEKEEKQKFKPATICIGQGMVIKGFDNALEDKEIKKEYVVEINPKNAFGMRSPKLIKTVPITAFKEMPAPGMFVNVNGMVAKVITLTSGRVLIDLNNPLAGKPIIYNFKINKIIEKDSEKIKILGEIFGIDISEKNIQTKDNKVKIKLNKESEEESEEESKKEKQKEEEKNREKEKQQEKQEGSKEKQKAKKIELEKIESENLKKFKEKIKEILNLECEFE